MQLGTDGRGRTASEAPPQPPSPTKLLDGNAGLESVEEGAAAARDAGSQRQLLRACSEVAAAESAPSAARRLAAAVRTLDGLEGTRVWLLPAAFTATNFPMTTAPRWWRSATTPG